jgi:hypothetical protein
MADFIFVSCAAASREVPHQERIEERAARFFRMSSATGRACGAW